MPKPDFILTQDFTIRDDAISLLIQGDAPDTVISTIYLPVWEGLRQDMEGPHEIRNALYLVHQYAASYGYREVMVKICGPQGWDPAWGELILW